MVKGTTKSGIDFEIDPKIADDTRLLFYMRKLRCDDAEEQNDALFTILSIMFGGDDGLMSFMNAVASVHDGICDSVNLMNELTEIFEAAKLKN